MVCSNYFDFCKTDRDSSPEFLTVDDFRRLDSNWFLFDKLMGLSIEEAVLALSLNPIDFKVWDLLGLELSCAMTALDAKYIPRPSDTPLVQYDRWPENTRLAISLCEQFDIYDELLGSERFWKVLNDFARFMKSAGSAMEEIRKLICVFRDEAEFSYKKRHP